LPSPLIILLKLTDKSASIGSPNAIIKILSNDRDDEQQTPSITQISQTQIHIKKNTNASEDEQAQHGRDGRQKKKKKNGSSQREVVPPLDILLI
jgi:hypothetical protein